MNDDLVNDDFPQRLVRIARSIEAGEIYYNAAKLAWATMFSEQVQLSNSAGLLSGQELLAEMSAVVEQLRSSGRRQKLVEVWEVSIATMADSAYLSLAEVPETRVCRACGWIYFGAPPKRCKSCGASHFTFRDFPVPWWPEPLTAIEALDAMRSAPTEIEAAFRGMSDDAMSKKPSSNGWSVRDVLAHLLHSDGVVRGRIQLMLENDDPALENITVGQQAKGPDAPASAIFDRYVESREETVALLVPLTSDGWLRHGHHSGLGSKTILHQASYFTKHERLHVPHIEAIRREVDFRQEGERPLTDSKAADSA